MLTFYNLVVNSKYFLLQISRSSGKTETLGSPWELSMMGSLCSNRKGFGVLGIWLKHAMCNLQKCTLCEKPLILINLYVLLFNGMLFGLKLRLKF